MNPSDEQLAETVLNGLSDCDVCAADDASNALQALLGRLAGAEHLRVALRLIIAIPPGSDDEGIQARGIARAALVEEARE